MRRILLKVLKIPNKIKYEFYLKWNKLLLYINNIEYGKNPQIYNRVFIKKHPQSYCQIGDNFVFTSGNGYNPLCRNIMGCIYIQHKDSSLIIGDNVGMSSTCLWVKEKIEIGNNVLIGGDTIIMDTDAHNLDYNIRRLRMYTLDSEKLKEKAKEFNINFKDLNHSKLDSLTASKSPIKINDDVLIGTRCIILKGVTIGARSIIGSGSIVTKSIPSDCIAAGNPAKVIKYIK